MVSTRVLGLAALLALPSPQAIAQPRSSFRVLKAERDKDGLRVDLIVDHHGAAAKVDFFIMQNAPRYGGGDLERVGRKVLADRAVKAGATPLSLRVPAGIDWVKPGATVCVGCNFAGDGYTHAWGITSRMFGVDRNSGTTFAVPNSALRRRPTSPWLLLRGACGCTVRRSRAAAPRAPRPARRPPK